MEKLTFTSRILAPLGIVSLAVLAFYVFSLQQEESYLAERQMADNTKSLEAYYQEAINQRAHKLTTALDIISRDRGMLATIKGGDRDSLLAYSRPLFAMLKTQHNITHFYIHDRERKNRLRLHHPEQWGDRIDRFTAQQAERNGDMTQGVELGRLGTFTLRAVKPVSLDGQRLGYLELGEEVDDLIGAMASAFHVELITLLDKQYLSRTDWETGMQTLGRSSDWATLPDSVVASSSIQLQADTLRRLNNRAEHDIKLQGHHYRVSSMPLRDARQREVGKLLMLWDMSTDVHHSFLSIVAFTLSALFGGSLLFGFFFWTLRRTEQALALSQRGLQESQALLSNAQHMAHLGNWELRQGEVHCTEEAARILGLASDSLRIPLATLLDIVHPADRQAFLEFIDKVRDTPGIHDLIHRIAPTSGKERTVHHRAELRSAQGRHPQAPTVSAIIHDITELQQAEKYSTRLGRIMAHSWNEIYTFDADSLRFIEVSDGARKNLQYSMKELLRLTPTDIKPEINREQFEALVAPLRSGERQQISFETKHRRKDGSLYPVEVRLQLFNDEVPPVFTAIIQDISERMRYLAELEHQALYDALTELPNRTLLLDRLSQLLSAAQRDTRPLAVISVDVMRLKEINDILGHHSGDQVLQEVARRLSSLLRKSDSIGRLSGDEFAIVLPGMGIDHIPACAQKIQALFQQPFMIQETALEIEAAIGIALYPDHGDTVMTLLQHANIAMHVASSEASGFAIYNPQEDPYSLRHLKLLGELRQAIDNQGMMLYYQPKVDLKRGRVTAVEALARWQHPTEGMIPPGDFIPMVEQSGLIRPFTLWALEEAIRQAKQWQTEGIELSVAVNLSTRNLLDPELPDNIAQLLARHQLSPEHLTLEITESAVMSRPEAALRILNRLRSIGLKLSIDDFGTGYSSLAYLKRLPVDELKIDYSFIQGITREENDAVIVCSTIELAQNLGLHVVAEGIEDRDTLDILSLLHCDHGQGYFFSRPLPADDFIKWLGESPWGGQRVE